MVKLMLGFLAKLVQVGITDQAVEAHKNEIMVLV